jgi:hypothetical protein
MSFQRIGWAGRCSQGGLNLDVPISSSTFSAFFWTESDVGINSLRIASKQSGPHDAPGARAHTHTKWVPCAYVAMPLLPGHHAPEFPIEGSLVFSTRRDKQIPPTRVVLIRCKSRCLRLKLALSLLLFDGQPPPRNAVWYGQWQPFVALPPDQTVTWKATDTTDFCFVNYSF